MKYGEEYLLVELQINGVRVCLKYNQKIISVSFNEGKPFFILDHSLVFAPAENPTAEEIALTEFLTNPPNLSRKEINWKLMREIRKHTLSVNKQVIGEKYIRLLKNGLMKSLLNSIKFLQTHLLTSITA